MLVLHRLRHVNALAIVVHFSAVVTVGCLGYAVVTGLAGQPIDLTALADPATLGLLAAVGGLASVGQITMTRAFAVGRPQRLAVVGLTQVVFALGFDLGLWHYRLDEFKAAGMILVLAPVAWLVGRRALEQPG